MKEITKTIIANFKKVINMDRLFDVEFTSEFDGYILTIKFKYYDGSKYVLTFSGHNNVLVENIDEFEYDISKAVFDIPTTKSNKYVSERFDKFLKDNFNFSY